MIEAWNALWTNISPKICGGKLNKAAGKRGRSRRRSAYALQRSLNTARAGRSPRSPRLPNCAVFWTARRMTFWGSGAELLPCRTLHRKKPLTCTGGARVFRRAPPIGSCGIQFSCRSPHHRLWRPPRGRLWFVVGVISRRSKRAREDSTGLPPRGSCCPTRGEMPAYRSISTMRRTSPNGAKSAKRGIPPQGAEYKSEEIPHTQGRALKKARPCGSG